MQGGHSVHGLLLGVVAQVLVDGGRNGRVALVAVQPDHVARTHVRT